MARRWEFVGVLVRTDGYSLVVSVTTPLNVAPQLRTVSVVPEIFSIVPTTLAEPVEPIETRACGSDAASTPRGRRKAQLTASSATAVSVFLVNIDVGTLIIGNPIMIV